MVKSETVEIQKEIRKKGGKLSRYQDLILGQRSLAALLKYELVMGVSSRVPGAFGLFLRAKLYPLLLGRTGRNVMFGTGVVIRHPGKIRIGNNVVVDDHCVLDAKGSDNSGITIGDGVFLGRNTILNCKNGDIILEQNVNIGFNCTLFSASTVRVGADNLMAAYCYLVGGTHRFEDPAVPVLDQGRESRGISVGPGGWIGAHVTVFDGVQIGKHAVIGAGSVVNKDIPDYAVAAGIPVKVLKDRKPKKSRDSDSSAIAGPRRRMLYVSMYDPHVPYTGAGARGAQFVNDLARHYDIDLVYMTGSGHPGNPDLESRFRGRISGVKSLTAVPFSARGYFLYSKPMYRAAENLLEERGHEWIFCDYGLAARYGLKLSRKFGIPFIYSSHNVEFRQYLGKAKSDPRRWPLVPYVRFYERRAVQDCAVLVSVSGEDAAFYSRWISPDKIVIVPQGFDAEVYHPFYKPKRNKTRIVLFFGNYGISTNREAVRTVRDRIADAVVREWPDVIFRFIGANPPVELAHPRFEFKGFVDSIVDEIQGADVVIAPMTGGWGMPTKVIESLACGKPVVATETGARTVSREYSRLMVCPVDQFPETIIRLLRENRPVDAADYERLKKEYQWSVRLVELRKKIDSYGKSGFISA